MKNQSIQNATLLTLAMAIVAGGFNIIADHTIIGVGLVAFGGALPFGREYLKDARAVMNSNSEEKKVKKYKKRSTDGMV